MFLAQLENLRKIFLLINKKNNVSHHNRFNWVQLESSYTCIELLKLIEYFITQYHAFKEEYHNAKNEEILNKLNQFLMLRWARIKNTHAAYTQNNLLPANQCCLALASVIEKKFKGGQYSRYQLLMPTIQHQSSDITLTALHDNDLEISQFVLSDDNERFIEILPCLDCIENDGRLKHTMTVHGETCDLSEHEQHRVIGHNKYSRLYYDALMGLYHYRNNGASLGAILRSFIYQLRLGGKKKEGHEYDAGASSNIAIVNFNDFIHGLNSKNKRLLFEAQNQRGEKLFQVWDKHIARASGTDGRSASYCVECAADTLENILEENPHLYDQLVDGETNNAIRVLEEEVRSKRRDFEKSLRANGIRNKKYGTQGVAQLIENMIHDKNILHFLITSIIQTPALLPVVWRSLSLPQQKNLLRKIDEYHLEDTIKANVKKIIEGFSLLEDTELELLFGLCLKEVQNIAMLINTVDKVALFISGLKITQKSLVIKKYFSSYLKKLQDIVLIWRVYPEVLVKHFSEKSLRVAIHSGNALIKALNLLDDHEKISFLNMIDDSVLTYMMCDDITYAGLLISLKDSERREFYLSKRDIFSERYFFETTYQIMNIMIQLSMSECEKFLQCFNRDELSEKFIQDKISANNFINLLMSLSQEKRFLFISYLGGECSLNCVSI